MHHIFAVKVFVDKRGREREKLVDRLLTYHALVLGFSPVQDMLHHVVAVLVLDQSLDVTVELLQDGGGLLGGAVLEDALDHPTAVRVSREVVHLALERVDDELQPTWLHRLDTLLHDVVPVLVLDALKNIAVKFL